MRRKTKTKAKAKAEAKDKDKGKSKIEKKLLIIKKLLHGKKIMLIKIKDVAEMLAMNQSNIYKLVYHKAIPYIKIGGALRFDKDKIIAWINQNSCDMINPKSKRL